jgi:autophagy-related protein 9
MDPFAPDSDQEDERTSQGVSRPFIPHLNSTDSALDRSNVGQHALREVRESVDTLHDSIASREVEEDDGPPASIVLDAHDNDEELDAGVGGSVRLTPLTKGKQARVDSRSDDEDVRRSRESDEEANLMGAQARSRPGQGSTASRNRRKREKGMLSSMAQKIKRKADKIRLSDSRMVNENGPEQTPLRRLDAKQRALWTWGTLENMDEFLQEVYAYYVGKGLVCILLTKTLNLLTIAFVIGFSMFLVGCVDYGAIKHDGRLSEVVVPQCFSRFSGLTILSFALFAAMYLWQVVRFGFGVSKLLVMRNFYTHLLNIPDADVQAISWHEVVSRISHLRDTHPTLSVSSSNGVDPIDAGKLDAHDIANRIMRQENYLVALFNKDVLNLTIPMLGLQHRAPELTRTLEWNLTFCLLGFLFDGKGQVRKQFVSERHRTDLIEGLRRRFIFMAVINAIFAPFIVIYLLFYSFFRYFEEYHKNPSSIGARQYTQFARWKFREFNELPHIFQRRCHNSYAYAQRYIDQFPKERTAILARFASFIAGSFTAVLILASVIDPDLFVHFDITPQRNTLFYIGVFGAILTVSRALVPDDQQVFEPEVLLRAVIEYTHYLPAHWKGRFHSTEVHAEFGAMYRLKLYIFFSEILSVLFTPFILWKSLPKSAPAIIDFFREFTVHVDGLGYVCSFAVFDFQRHGNAHFGAPNASRDTRLSSKEGKMEQSLLGFRAANPSWQPTDPTASLFLSRLAAEMAQNAGQTAHPSPIGRLNAAHDLQSATATSASTNDMSAGKSTGHVGHLVNFTPANSTLAQRGQMYNNAFDRSILLASKRNAAALQASATKTGPRSTAAVGAAANIRSPQIHHSVPRSGSTHNAANVSGARAALQVVDEDNDVSVTATEPGYHANEMDPLDVTGNSIYEDARPDRQYGNVADPSELPQPANLRGLLQHIGASRW